MAVATTLLGGLAAYGVTATAGAAAPARDPQPAPSVTVSSATVSTAPGAAGIDAMIRHCTDQLPAGQRSAAATKMREMMTDHDGPAGNSMMGGRSGDSITGMMGGRSGDSITGMMGGAGS